MKRERLFHAAVLLSFIAHGVLLFFKAGPGSADSARIVKIPVMLEAEEPPPPPPPPPPPKPDPPKKKARPKNLARKIKKVVDTGDGLRTGDLVEAEVGEYSEEPEPPPPPPPPPPPKAKPKPKPPEVDKVAVTREYLSLLRNKLAATRKYPLAAQRMGITGAVTVSFVVDPDSKFSNVVVRRSSGHDLLDNAAKAAVEGMSGKLLRPSALGEIKLKTSVVLRYELNG